MTENIQQAHPNAYQDILQETIKTGFTMASDLQACSLLRTLASTKPNGSFLELGTGSGLSTSWILDGMDKTSTLISIDHDPDLLTIAHKYLGQDERLTLIEIDGEKWVNQHKRDRYDFIFADTWHGKYLLLDEVLHMLNKGGLYVIDDMLPADDWPEGHAEKASQLEKYLESRNDLWVAKQAWATGMMIAVKK